MRKTVLLTAFGVSCVALVFCSCCLSEPSTSVGIGAHYWRTLSDPDSFREFDRNGVGWYATFRYNFSDWVGVEATIHRMPKGFLGADEQVYAPQALLVVGKGIYAGAGIGNFYMGGSFYDDSYYILRGGVSLNVLPFISLDLHADYLYTRWDDIESIVEDISTETIMVGTAVRLGF